MEKYIVAEIPEEQINWDTAEKAPINHYGWVKCTHYDAYAQMVFVKGKGFKVKLTCLDGNPWAKYKNDMDPVYLDSCLEAFFSFGEEGYVNLETNCLGVRLQAIGKGRDNRTSLFSLHEDFLVKADKREDRFEIFIDLPLKAIEKLFPSAEGKIESGFSFKGNFYKTGCNPETREEHYGMWNEIEAPSPDFHRPEQFGELLIR